MQLGEIPEFFMKKCFDLCRSEIHSRQNGKNESNRHFGNLI